MTFPGGMSYRGAGSFTVAIPPFGLRPHSGIAASDALQSVGGHALMQTRDILVRIQSLKPAFPESGNRFSVPGPPVKYPLNTDLTRKSEGLHCGSR